MSMPCRGGDSDDEQDVKNVPQNAIRAVVRNDEGKKEIVYLNPAPQSRIELIVNITSDNICPWCYVGKRHLDIALMSLDKSQMDIRTIWWPYMLDQTLPSNPGTDKMEHYKRKFGEQRAETMIKHMCEKVGPSVNVKFDYGGLIGNTLDSHRLVKYAQLPMKARQSIASKYKWKDVRLSSLSGMQDCSQGDLVVEQIMKAYFTQQQDLSDPDVLVKCGVAAGLSESEVSYLMKSDVLKGDILAEVGMARQRGVQGVPSFHLVSRFPQSYNTGSPKKQFEFRWSGGQGRDFLLNVFRQALKLPFRK